MKIDKNHNFPFECPNCRKTIHLDEELVKKYLQCEFICSCNTQINLFDEIIKVTSALGIVGGIYPLIGAKIRLNTVALSLGLNHVTAPNSPDEELFWISYTPQIDPSDKVPSELIYISEYRGPFPSIFDYHSNKIMLVSTKPCSVNMLGWVIKRDTASIWHQLMIEACDMYTKGKFTLLAVPVNAACEHLTGKYFNQILQNKGIGQDKIDEFLKNGASYGHQLKVFAPAFLKPKLPDQIYQALQELRSYRNKIAHGEEIFLQKKSVYVKWIVAAVFSRIYFNIAKFENS